MIYPSNAWSYTVAFLCVSHPVSCHLCTCLCRVKLEVAQANEARKQELDVRERKLHSEIALVAQQQLIHERMIVDLSDAKCENNKLQAEMQVTCSRLGSAMAEKDMLAAKLEAMSDYDGTLFCSTQGGDRAPQ